MRLQRRPGTWTLRTRLVLALLILAAVGLVTVGGSSVLLLQRSLVAKVDERLIALPVPSGEGQRAPMPPKGTDRLPTDFRVLFFDSTYHLERVLGRASADSSAPRVSPARMRNLCAHGETATVPDDSGGAGWRMRCNFLRSGEVVGVALSLANTRATVNRLLLIELVAGSSVLLLLAVVAWLVVRIGLRPLSSIEETADGIAAGELERRVPEHDPRTETGRLAAALNTMLARLSEAMSEREQSERRLRNFVADASHELRTPLTSIRGFAELYRQSEAVDAGDVTRLMSRIEEEAQRMGDLVEDLLLLARLDRERPLDLSDLDLVPLLEDVVNSARARHADHRVQELLPAQPSHVHADRLRLRQVVDNLLTNALLHAGSSSNIRVRAGYGVPHDAREVNAVAGSDAVGDTRMASIEVEDEGPGIAVQDAARIFDRFYRVSDGRERASGGTGLGLAIVAAIVQAHDARIEMISTPGEGTTFRMLIPFT